MQTVRVEPGDERAGLVSRQPRFDGTRDTERFVDRELDRLRAFYKTDDAALAVVYGRRRIGQDHLVLGSITDRDDAVSRWNRARASGLAPAVHEAEAKHQDYYDKNPTDRYCRTYAEPTVRTVRETFETKSSAPR